MIHLKELRIGNKVIFSEDGSVCDVVGIDEKGLTVNIFEKQEEHVWIELEYFEPIKLTEKCLIDLGFENRSSNQFYISVSSTNIMIKIFEDGAHMLFINNIPTGMIRHLHKLQNLLIDLI